MLVVRLFAGCFSGRELHLVDGDSVEDCSLTLRRGDGVGIAVRLTKQAWTTRARCVGLWSGPCGPRGENFVALLMIGTAE